MQVSYSNRMSSNYAGFLEPISKGTLVSFLIDQFCSLFDDSQRTIKGSTVVTEQEKKKLSKNKFAVISVASHLERNINSSESQNWVAFQDREQCSV